MDSFGNLNEYEKKAEELRKLAELEEAKKQGLTVEQLREKKASEEEEQRRAEEAERRKKELAEQAKQSLIKKHGLSELDYELLTSEKYGGQDLDFYEKINGGIESLLRICRRDFRRNLIEFHLRDECNKYTFENFKCDTPERKATFDAVSNFLREEKQFLVLYGKNGNGKTHLAFALARKILFDTAKYKPANITLSLEYYHDDNPYMRDTDYRVKHCAYLTGNEIAVKKRHLETGFEKDKRGETVDYSDFVSETVAKNSVIIIDEIGQGNEKGYERGAIYDFVDRCQKEDKFLFLISNLGFDELTKFLSQRTVDRLSECVKFVEFNGPSFRREKGTRFTLDKINNQYDYDKNNVYFSVSDRTSDTDPLKV